MIIIYSDWPLKRFAHQFWIDRVNNHIHFTLNNCLRVRSNLKTTKQHKNEVRFKCIPRASRCYANISICKLYSFLLLEIIKCENIESNLKFRMNVTIGWHYLFVWCTVYTIHSVIKLICIQSYRKTKQTINPRLKSMHTIKPIQTIGTGVYPAKSWHI